MLNLLKAAVALQHASNISELTNTINQMTPYYFQLQNDIRTAIARLNYEPSLDLILILYNQMMADETVETYTLLEDYCRSVMSRHGEAMESLIRTIFQTRDQGDEEWERALVASATLVVCNQKEVSLKPYPAIAIFFVYGMIHTYYYSEDYADATTIVANMDAAMNHQPITAQIHHPQIFRRMEVIRSAPESEKRDYLISIGTAVIGSLTHDRADQIIKDRYSSYMSPEDILPIVDDASTHMRDFMREYETYQGNSAKVEMLYQTFQLTMQIEVTLLRSIMQNPNDSIIRSFLLDCFNLKVLRGMHEPSYPDTKMIQEYLVSFVLPEAKPLEDLDPSTAGIIWALQIPPAEGDVDIDWDVLRFQSDPPAEESALEAYDRKSTTLNKASQKIYNGFKAYKNAEDKVDSQLAKMISATKRLFMGDARTEIVEGKEFSPIGLLKKALATAAVFSYSKVGGLVFLVVRFALRKNSTMAEKKSILMEIETEMKMLDEKIDDARGDGNRQAKYAMMRTKSELQNAYNKIKYGLEADKRSMSTAKRIVGVGQASADSYERRRKK